MIEKILIFIFVTWLFFKLFGKRILLYLVKKLVQKLEQQTLKDMKHFQNLYDDKARYSYPLNEDFTVIIPENYSYEKRNKKIVIEEVEFEEYPKDEIKNEGNFTR